MIFRGWAPVTQKYCDEIGADGYAPDASSAAQLAVHRICGLSNVSFGLPARKLFNQSFMVMAMDRGLDAAIVDTLDGRLMALALAASALAGRDEYCADYLAAYRRGKLEA